MKLAATLTLALLLATLAGCSRAANRTEPATSPANSSSARGPMPIASQGGEGGGAAMQDVSLQQAEARQAAPAAVERKIIRNADLTLEVEEPSKALPRVASVAESRGGFVVNTESRQQSAGGSGGRTYETITLEMRVPAEQFDSALGELRSAGRVTSEKISGKDVTEEYIDLEARLRTQRALEAQLLEIMKDAHSVADAVSVQRELANVRTEIERVEGRRRFLENQASLSTISVTLQPPAPLVSTTGFFRSVGTAFGEGIDIAAAVTLFLIRAALALLPVFVFIFLPAYFILRFLVRRLRRRPAPPPVREAPPNV